MTYTAQGHTTIRRARNGAPGKGIASMLSLFAISDQRSVAAYGDISGWTETLPTATEQEPYLWQCVKTTYTTGDEEYSTPVLVATYSAAANANLLENASFVSPKRMDAWTTQSVYQVVTGQTAPDTSADGHGISTSEKVEGRNSYYDVCEATSSVVEYKNVLQQQVATSKLTKGAWHTLSFWAKGWQELIADRTYSDSIIDGTTQTLSLKAGVTYTLTITASVTSLAMTNKRVLRCRLLNGTTEVASHDFSSSFALTWITSVTPNADTDYTLTIALYDKSASMVSISGVTGTVETAYLTDNTDLQTYLYSKAIVDTSEKIYMDGAELTPNSDLGLTWALSTTWAKHTLTFKTKSSLSGNTNVLFRLPPCLADGADRKVWICMPKLETGFFATAFIDSAADAKGEDGDAGIAGQIVRTSEWVAGGDYHNDTEPTEDGIRYLDVVISGSANSRKIYQCKQTHQDATVVLTDTTYWKPMNDMAPIYTPLIMADNAALTVMQSNRIAVMSTDGTAVQGCLTGVSDATDYMMWIGGTSASAANFRVKYDGTMEAVNGKFKGEVEATSGTFRNVDVYGSFRSPFVVIGDSFEEQQSDNLYSSNLGSHRVSTLPWGNECSGRRITVIGAVSITAPTGKYFFEDGRSHSTLTTSYEVVELLGFGTTSFQGYIVLSRTMFKTNYGHGRRLHPLAFGTVTGTSSSANIQSWTFDDKTLGVTRESQGTYKITFPTNWFSSADYIIPMVTGLGTIVDGTNPVYANVKEKVVSSTSAYITVVVGDDRTPNDGSFTFMLYNAATWSD